MESEDAEMVIYDPVKGYVASLHRARWLDELGTWAAAGGSVAYLASNGLEGSLPQSDEERNWSSHRGLNGAIMAVHHDQVFAREISQIHKVGVSQSSPHTLFPMTGSDGWSTHPAAPAQGTRLRIRPDIALEDYGLSREALVIAEALQRYGMIIGDTTTGPIELKLESQVLHDTPWEVERYDLCRIPLTDFEVIDDVFDRGLAKSPMGDAVQARDLDFRSGET